LSVTLATQPAAEGPKSHHTAPRRTTQAYRLLELADHALKELRRQQAAGLAPFEIGDHILVTTTMKNYPPDPRRYIICDMRW